MKGKHMAKVFEALQRAVRATGRGICALVREWRDALREDGVASGARWGSFLVLATWCFIAIYKKAIPERTEQTAWLIGALYGLNQLKQVGTAIAQAKQAATGQAGQV